MCVLNAVKVIKGQWFHMKSVSNYKREIKTIDFQGFTNKQKTWKVKTCAILIKKEKNMILLIFQTTRGLKKLFFLFQNRTHHCDSNEKKKVKKINNYEDGHQLRLRKEWKEKETFLFSLLFYNVNLLIYSFLYVRWVWKRKVKVSFSTICFLHCHKWSSLCDLIYFVYAFHLMNYGI